MPNGSCELQFFDVVAATNLELFSIRVVKWHTIRTARPQDICVVSHLAFPRLNRQSTVQSSLRNGMHYAYTRKAILWNYLRDIVWETDVWRGIPCRREAYTSRSSLGFGSYPPASVLATIRTCHALQRSDDARDCPE